MFLQPRTKFPHFWFGKNAGQKADRQLKNKVIEI
jgi:hypothetical protein